MDLIEMYPAAVNSKVTVTLGVLNADSTIIEVLDGSVLPDAPNLLVLGSDQTAETVKLTAKEGNTLTVERGIQGNAIAWPAGTQVARNFTAKDWDDLVANIATIVAKIMGLNANDVGALPDTTKQIDIGARPNANLLHNWYFGNPVNRNGKTEYGEKWQMIDRWRIREPETITLTENGLYVKANNGTTGAFAQDLATTENQSMLNELKGKTVTLTTLYGDGTLISSTCTLPESVSANKNFGYGYKTDNIYHYLRWYDNGNLIFDIWCTANNTEDFTVIAFKLELGDTQSLAHQDSDGNWVLNEIPDYAEQMAICMQYDKSSGAYLGESLPSAGGTMTGSIVKNGVLVRNPTDGGYLWIMGGSETTNGAKILLAGQGDVNSGVFQIYATNSEGNKVLIGKPDGSLTWCGKEVFVAESNAGFHNSVYRGKNLGAAVTDAQWTAIKNGTFEDLYIGDYWTIGDINYRIAAFDYYYKAGDTSCTTHHVVLVPDTNMYTHAMNDTNITDGAYVNSKMYAEGLTQAKTTITSAFGSAHILKHRQYLQNATSNGIATGGAWYDSTVELMTEQNVYGCKVFGNGINGTTFPNNYTIDKSQYPLFAFRPDMISNRQWFWLRDVASASLFAYVGSGGTATCDTASNANGVRPAFSIC